LLFGSIAESFKGLREPSDPRRGHSSSTTSGRKEETHHPPLKLDRDATGSDQRCERKAAQWGNECDPMKSKGNPNLDVATKDVDNSVHDDSDINNDHDFLDVMILRKGRKIKHRRK
jgi:hypothetical protein